MIRVKATLEVMNAFVVDALATSEPIAEPRITLLEDLRNPRLGEKALENCEEEEQESSQNVPVGIIDLGTATP